MYTIEEQIQISGNTLAPQTFETKGAWTNDFTQRFIKMNKQFI